MIVSPLTRKTLQTAQNIFKTNVKMIAFGETMNEYPQGKHTCNRRSDLSSLKQKFPEIDFTNIVTDETFYGIQIILNQLIPY